MKKSTKAKTEPKGQEEDLLPHYDFDYSKGKKNPYAAQIPPGSLAVVLDPDVASFFRTSDAVNTLLRSVIAALRENAGPSGSSSRKGA